MQTIESHDLVFVSGGTAAANSAANAELGATIGKGVMTRITRADASTFVPEVLSFVAIYTALALRDTAIEAALGQALRVLAEPDVSADPVMPRPSSGAPTPGLRSAPESPSSG